MWAKTRKDGFLLDGASRGLASAARRKGLAGHSQQRHGALLPKSAGIPPPRVAVGAVVPIRHHRRAASIHGVRWFDLRWQSKATTSQISCGCIEERSGGIIQEIWVMLDLA